MLLDILCTLSTITCNTKKVELPANISAYTASIDETDNEPCITADGTNICGTNEMIVANNCLPFNTIININGIGYRVADRMNRRFGCEKFDILMKTKKEALKWGVKKQIITYYK